MSECRRLRFFALSRRRAIGAGALFLGTLAAVGTVAQGACARKRRDNVLLITLDTTRADYLSSYGYPEPTTPRLDELAGRGTRFDHAVSTSAVTPVAHASILTGLDNPQHGLRVLSAEAGFRLRPEVPTLATVLKSSGYHTAAVHSAFPVSSHFGFDRGFDVFESLEASIRVGIQGKASHSWEADRFQRRSDETTDLVLDVLRETSEPYFLWVHYWDPHDGHRLPPREFLPAEWSDSHEGKGARSSWKQRRRRLYAAEVQFMDAQIGRLLDSLDESGQADHTVVVVVADHGQGLGDHGWMHHRLLYREQIRVPLLLAIPGVCQVPQVRALVRITDILPTILDFLGIEAPGALSGASLRPVLAGRREPGRIAFADQINGYDLNARMLRRRFDDFLYAVADGEWKLIYRATHPEKSLLYHSAVDPDETQNVYDRYPEQVLRLKQELARQGPWITTPFRAEGEVDLSGAREALEALGYVGSEEGADGVARYVWSWVCPGDPSIRGASSEDRGQCSTPLIPQGRRE